MRLQRNASTSAHAALASSSERSSSCIARTESKRDPNTLDLSICMKRQRLFPALRLKQILFQFRRIPPNFLGGLSVLPSFGLLRGARASHQHASSSPRSPGERPRSSEMGAAARPQLGSPPCAAWLRRSPRLKMRSVPRQDARCAGRDGGERPCPCESDESMGRTDPCAPLLGPRPPHARAGGSATSTSSSAKEVVIWCLGGAERHPEATAFHAHPPDTSCRSPCLSARLYSKTSVSLSLRLGGVVPS